MSASLTAICLPSLRLDGFRVNCVSLSSTRNLPAPIACEAISFAGYQQHAQHYRYGTSARQQGGSARRWVDSRIPVAGFPEPGVKP